ncbi:MAG: leucyl/phenylalanyl-tRNA--protein transferase [Gammaproteobacteria bacterium]
MTHVPPTRPVPWLEPGQAFPPADEAWGPDDPAPGLLAAGGVLDVPTLVAAYSQGIFPWYSTGQPILWWSTDPRMVLAPASFRLHRSLRKEIRSLRRQGRLEIRIDHDFPRVIRHCAQTRRGGQLGTWILPSMIDAYIRLHRSGLAHSVETWIDGKLDGGLYCVSLGGMVFGESMFSHRSNASKMALAALVATSKAAGVTMIDCQQETRHLASMGASPVTRSSFLQRLRLALQQPAPSWHFDPVYWDQLFDGHHPDA